MNTYFIIAFLTVLSEAFILNVPKKGPSHIRKNVNHDNIICQNCNERALYKNYLLSLRKIRRTVNPSNVEGLISLLNFTVYTNNLLANSTVALNNTQSVEINNENMEVRKIIMANMHIDVSNVKYIQISTKKDTIIVELDKKNKLNNLLTDINNIDALINTLSLVLKFLNVS